MDFQPPCPLEVLELLVIPEQPYPLICVGLNKGTELNQPVSFQTLDPNSSCPNPPDTGTTPTDTVASPPNLVEPGVCRGSWRAATCILHEKESSAAAHVDVVPKLDL